MISVVNLVIAKVGGQHVQKWFSSLLVLYLVYECSEVYFRSTQSQIKFK